MSFLSKTQIHGTWQSFERTIARYLICRGYEGVRIVGTTGDKGADIIAHKFDKRWLFQSKYWRRPATAKEVTETIRALPFYNAQVAVLVCLGGFDTSAISMRDRYSQEGLLSQLWSARDLFDKGEKIIPDSYPPHSEKQHQTREYQEKAIKRLVDEYYSSHKNHAMIVMATGLGKTRVLCEFVRRLSLKQKPKILILAHANDLVYQLEKNFWDYLYARQTTLIWNGLERQTLENIEKTDAVFACLNTVSEYIKSGGYLPNFDVVLVDECHHVGDVGMYADVLSHLEAGEMAGSFLVGVTATPWRPDDSDLEKRFGEPLISIDLVAGLKNGFLANIDYRMYTTNLDWSKIGGLKNSKKKVTPKGINRTLFISEWDDGVVDQLENAWREQKNPRAIVFCGTIQHAQMMRDKINARRFCLAEAIFSGGKGKEKQAIYQRNKIISDFHIGKVQVICCVDIFNEGIDVPDVNIVVFQRVTHSRRIFVQQLGRGLRLTEDKKKVIVLDFVSDVRRFAAGLNLKDAIKDMPIRLNHKIDFYQYGKRDEKAESFLREWLDDISDVENMGENNQNLRYPPPVKG